MLTIEVTPDPNEDEDVVIRRAIELAERLGVKVRFKIGFVELTASPDGAVSILNFYEGMLRVTERPNSDAFGRSDAVGPDDAV